MALTDWDWQGNISHRSLAADWFTTSPFSLKLTGVSGIEYIRALSRIAGVQNVVQGSIRTWVYQTTAGSQSFMFRNQEPLGAATYLEAYSVDFAPAMTALMRRHSGVNNTVGQWAYILTQNVAHEMRIDWWNGVNGSGIAALCVDLYERVGGIWTLCGTTLFDTLNMWSGSAINRPGFTLSGQNACRLWTDDFEIWIP